MRYHRTHRQISQSNFKDIKSQSHTNTKAQNIEGYTTVFKTATNYIQNYPISMKYYNWFSHSEPFMHQEYIVLELINIFLETKTSLQHRGSTQLLWAMFPLLRKLLAPIIIFLILRLISYNLEIMNLFKEPLKSHE